MSAPARAARDPARSAVKREAPTRPAALSSSFVDFVLLEETLARTLAVEVPVEELEVEVRTAARVEEVVARA